MNPDPDPVADRRADIDAKQTAIVPLLNLAGVDAMLLLMPAHVAWFTSGMNVRGLIADSERPGVFTNGRQRWLICSNVDTQRFFDEELDRLGFQLKEWRWESGRAELLAQISAGKKIAADRPFPNVQMANENLRPLLRVLTAFEQAQYRELGKTVAHAVEATARNCERGRTEAEIAGQLGHRLLHHGIETAAISVAADGRGAKYRRAGFGSAPVTRSAVVQATGQRDGLYATCARTVSFGPPPDDLRQAHDLATKQAAACRALATPSTTLASVGEAVRPVLANTPFEFDWRFSPPGYGAGRFALEELRKGGQDEPLIAGMAVVWQQRVGPAAVVDTLIIAEGAPAPVTPPDEWPVRRISVMNGPFHDIPDIFVSEG
jgi:Xaa-Pro aminopeptidase